MEGPGDHACERVKTHNSNRLLLALVLVALLPIAGLSMAPRVVADETSPKAWARSCDAGKLNLGKSSLQLAPILADDKDGQGHLIHRTTDERGRYVPVIFVHGWTSDSTHTSDRKGSFSHKIDLDASAYGRDPRVARSLIGQIQNLPGTAVFTYDYHPNSGNWVTRDSIGPGLGRSIDCLHRASGEKVIIIAHSMGGLAARQAVGRQSDGTDRSDKVSSVITFGTPNTGSLTALLVGAALNYPAPLVAVMHMILGTCGRLSSQEIESSPMCNALGAPIRTFEGEAVAGLTSGSKELKALPKFPSNINVVGLAGSAKVVVKDLGLFKAPWATKDVDVGDEIVMTSSALDGADSSKSISCRYQMSVERAATDAIGLAFGLTAKGDVAGAPIGLIPLGDFASPCFHTQLMRTIELTNTAMGAVVDDIEARQNQHGHPPQEAIPASELEDPSGLRTPVVVTLDTSGSMDEEVPTSSGSGTTIKIDAAKSAVLDLIDKSDPAQELGLITYPGGSATIEGCSSGEVKVPVRKIEKTSASLAVRSVSAGGDTPTSAALFRAAEILEQRGSLRGVIVLVSDGQSNCGETSVCDTAKELRDRGFELTVNSVGFDIATDSEAAKELRCVSSTTGGAYLEAGDAEGLRDQIAKAAGAFISIKADVPESIASVVGQATSGETAINVTVTNEAKDEAKDVRVALDFTGSDGVGGALLVPRPIRFVGNLAAGTTRSVSISVHPETRFEGVSFGWVASVTSQNGAANVVSGKASITPSDLSHVGPVLADVKSPVVMGDSYSAGEGAGDYLAGTDDPKHGSMCHRSDKTYAKVLFDSARNIACSGAVIDDLRGKQKSGSQQVISQIDALHDLTKGPNPPDGVLLTLGGNTIGFKDVIIECIATPRCSFSDVPSSAVEVLSPAEYLKEFRFGYGAEIDHGDKLNEVYNIGDPLKRAFADIDKVINSEDVVMKRGHEAPIVVLPYARITPRSGTGKNGCQLGFNTRELPYLNQLVDALNLTIHVAVGQMANQKRPFYFADDVQEAFQPGHTICDDTQSYAVFRRADIDGASKLSTVSSRTETAHPNANGYAAIASALGSWSRSVTPMVTKPLKTDSDIDVEDTSMLARAWSRATRTGVGGLLEEGATTSISGKGFRPGAQAVVWLESTPIPLGSALANADGEVSADVRLPDSVPRGSHHLVLTGLGKGGTQHTVRHSIKVFPRQTTESLFGVFAGIVLVALGLRRRRQEKLGTQHRKALSSIGFRLRRGIHRIARNRVHAEQVVHVHSSDK